MQRPNGEGGPTILLIGAWTVSLFLVRGEAIHTVVLFYVCVGRVGGGTGSCGNQMSVCSEMSCSLK